MLGKLINLFREKKGFTLIEVLVAVAVTSLIGLGAGVTTSQIFNVNGMTGSRMIAVKQVENAVSWISRDSQMAQVVQVGGGAGFPITLNWTEWDNTTHQVIYSIQNNQLKRSESINSNPAAVIVAADHISSDAALTNCQYASGIITYKLTVTVGGFRPASETRTFRIVPRPN
jgi:prepilin-type N-terminal cleavage/methylation domain-containing protein